MTQTKFEENASVMGLDCSRANQGFYSYSDRFGDVVYRTLVTQSAPTHELSCTLENLADLDEDSEDSEDVTEHETDGFTAPHIAIFTKKPSWDKFRYCRCISHVYKFQGHDVVTERVKASLRGLSEGVDDGVLYDEETLLSPDMCVLRNYVTIMNREHPYAAGNVHPTLIVGNSYDGSRAATLQFGLSIRGADGYHSNFAFELGKMRMVHSQYSTTTMTYGINNYIDGFTMGIEDLIETNMAIELNEDNIYAVLEGIDKLSEKKRDGLQEFLDEVRAEGTLTNWQFFLAITRYSCFQQNLNLKKLLENVAESVIVLPQRMGEMLEMQQQQLNT
jgi:hypothetical protein